MHGSKMDGQLQTGMLKQKSSKVCEGSKVKKKCKTDQQYV
jgi:hypothetical protein